MSRVYRSTPLNSIEELYSIYETSDPSAIPFLNKVAEAKNDFRQILHSSKFNEYGVVVSVNGTWGSGKTSFIQLVKEVFDDYNVTIINYDSLFYGNVSDATAIFIENIFKQVKERFGVELKNGISIAKNISPRLELSNGMPKFNIDFKPDRTPTELLKEEIYPRLKSIDGKIVVVIDDLDRVSGADILHFLRIVRVLRELPNFIVILPIDTRALENLIRGSGIDNPRKYLQKIIDHQIDINPDVASARNLFIQIIRRDENGLIMSNELIDTLWKMTLWSISLTAIDTDDIRSIGLNIGASSNDGNWQRIRSRLQSAETNSDLMRAFFNATSVSYGASHNLVLKVTNKTNPSVESYRHYVDLFSGQYFADFLNGISYPSLSPEQAIEGGDVINIMTTRWWRDATSLINNSFNPGRGNQSTQYDINVPRDPAQSAAYHQQMNAESITLWDEVQDLASIYFPYEALEHLAARSINKIVANFDLARLQNLASSGDMPETRDALYRDIKAAVNDAIVSS